MVKLNMAYPYNVIFVNKNKILICVIINESLIFKTKHKKPIIKSHIVYFYVLCQWVELHSQKLDTQLCRPWMRSSIMIDSE